MAGRTACEQRNGPVRLTRKTISQRLSGMSTTGQREIDGRVVHQDVDAAELRQGGLDHGVDAGLVGHVAADGEGPAARASRSRSTVSWMLPGSRSLGADLAAGGDDDVRAFPREAQRDGLADAPAGAGDDRDLAAHRCLLTDRALALRILAESARAVKTVASRQAPFAGTGPLEWRILWIRSVRSSRRCRSSPLSSGDMSAKISLMRASRT